MVKHEERDYSQRTLVQKLGIQPQHRVAVRNVRDESVLAELKASVLHKPSIALRGIYDLIFLQIDSTVDLKVVAVAAAHLTPNGGVWIFHPKGRGATPSDTDVRRAGLAAGLVDNKICALNDTHTATRFVIPRSARD